MIVALFTPVCRSGSAPGNVTAVEAFREPEEQRGVVATSSTASSFSAPGSSDNSMVAQRPAAKATRCECEPGCACLQDDSPDDWQCRRALAGSTLPLACSSDRSTGNVEGLKVCTVHAQGQVRQ
jgi:hypothetical protein